MVNALTTSGSGAVPISQSRLFPSPDAVAAPKDGSADLPAATGPAPLLGRDTKSVVNGGARSWKWTALEHLRKLHRGSRPSRCMRIRSFETRKTNQGISVIVNEGKARFRGLVACGSVWECPVCAERIASHRQKELQKIRDAWMKKGGRVFFVSYTVPHVASARLHETFRKLSEVDRKVKQDTAYRKMFKAWGCVGGVFNHEATYGGNGWHPHRHGLLFVMDKSVTAQDIQKALAAIWIRKLAAFGLSDLKLEDAFRYGIKVTDSSERITEYATKYGRLPKWDETKEVSLTVLKKGHGESVSPWGLLNMSMKGDINAGDLFIEYAVTMQGRRQLVMTPGLRAKVGLLDEDVTDEQAANEEPEGGEVVTVLTPSEWDDVCSAGLRGEVLEAAALLGASGVRAVVAEAQLRRRTSARCSGFSI